MTEILWRCALSYVLGMPTEVRRQDTLEQTADYPSSLNNTINSLRDSLPVAPKVPILTQMQDVLIAEDTIIASMAEKLESLAVHYDNMAGALKESEAGEAFSEEDLQGEGVVLQPRPRLTILLAMNRDTDELPIIMSELDESATEIETRLCVIVLLYPSSANLHQETTHHISHVIPRRPRPLAPRSQRPRRTGRHHERNAPHPRQRRDQMRRISHLPPTTPRNARPPPRALRPLPNCLQQTRPRNCAAAAVSGGSREHCQGHDGPT
mgnify:CR=1 FL=1